MIGSGDVGRVVARSLAELEQSEQTLEAYWRERGLDLEDLADYWSLYLLSALRAHLERASENPISFWSALMLRSFCVGVTLAREELQDPLNEVLRFDPTSFTPEALEAFNRARSVLHDRVGR